MFKEVTNMTWEEILKRKQVTLEDVLIYIIKRHRIPRKDKEKFVSSLLTELSGFPDDEDAIEYLGFLFGPNRDIFLFEISTDDERAREEMGDKTVDALLDAHSKITRGIQRIKYEIKSRKARDEEKEREARRKEENDKFFMENYGKTEEEMIRDGELAP
tara:strand:+ start:342 stop:818 length:477 start_codon:yes stop_codon:yes gene_type:complete